MAHRLDVWLANEARAMAFSGEDFAPVRAAHPGLEIVHHRHWRDFEVAVPDAELIDTWAFPAAWYARAPRLRAVFTPAAGRDWVMADPDGRVPTLHGTFHGPMIAESMLGLMLHFNRRIPAMLANESARGWDRNLQYPGSLLRHQHALLLGYGAIGRHCARTLRALGMSVAGCQRTHASGIDPEGGARYCRPGDLERELARADHVVLLLPGGEETRGFVSRSRLAAFKPGAFLYNFGRGTTVEEADLLWALDQGLLAGAGLDVTGEEPLPPGSSFFPTLRVSTTSTVRCTSRSCWSRSSPFFPSELARAEGLGASGLASRRFVAQIGPAS